MPLVGGGPRTPAGKPKPIYEEDTRKNYETKKPSSPKQPVVPMEEPSVEQAIAYESMPPQVKRFIPRPPAKTSFTREEYIQYLQYQRGQIKPTEQYIIDDSGRTYFGTYIQTQQYDPVIQQVKELSSDVTIVNTPTGIKVTRPPQPMSYASWYSSQRKREEQKDFFKAKTKQAAEGVLSFADPYFWVSVARGTEAQHEYLGQRFYPIQQQIKKGDYLGAFVGTQVPTYQNIIIPFSIGAGAGLIFKGISTFSKGLSGIASKVLGGIATKGPLILGTSAVTFASIDIGATIAYEQKGEVPVGTSIGKIGTYGLQFGSAYMGAKWVQSIKIPRNLFKKEALAFIDESGYVHAVGGRKYINILGKPVYFGKKMVGLPKSSMLSMRPQPTMPYQPSGLSKAPTIFSQPPMGVPFVPIKFKGTYGFITGEGWQPKQPSDISTLVYPKPKLYRSYETYFFFVTYTPPVKPIVTVKPKIDIKPFTPSKGKIYTAKDILKPEPTTTKDQITTGQRQQVILEQLKTQTIVETKKITSPLSKQIVVPESLQKQVVTTEKIIELKPKTQFKELRYIYRQEQKQIQSQSKLLIYGQLQSSIQDQKQLLRKQLGFSTISLQFQSQLQGQLQNIGQLQGQSISDIFRYDKIYDYIFETPPSLKIIRPTFPPEIYQPPPPPKEPLPPRGGIIGLPRLDEGGKRVKTIDMFPTSYQVQVKKTQYKNGKRIRGVEWVTLPNAFRTEHEAERYGKSIIEHNEKASIRVIPSTHKPSKLSKKIKYFDTNPLGYMQKGNIIIEMPVNRINTQGEVMSISRKGWMARRKHRRRK